MAYNPIATLDKLACNDYLDSGKCQDRFGQIPGSKNDSNYLAVNLKVLRKMTTKSSDWYKILQRERQISTSLSD